MPDTYESDESVVRDDRDVTIASELRVLDAALGELTEILGMIYRRIEPVLEPERTRPEKGGEVAEAADGPARSRLARDLRVTAERIERARAQAAQVYERIEL